MLRRLSFLLATVALAVGLAAMPRHLTSRPQVAPDYTNFETGQVHPAVMTPSGDRLLVINTPDGRLSVFDLTGERPHRIFDIGVGLEPVSVTALNDSVAWVVNNLSDDISIVNLTLGHVQRTLHVGDEPNDVVFAGPGPAAYVSVSQEDAIKVYDPSTLALMTTIPIPGRMPRSLGKTNAGDKVYVAIFNGGNRTSVLSAAEVADSIPDDPDFPRDPSNKLGHPAPAVAGIIQQNVLNDWRDEYGKLWNAKVKYSLPDIDVAEINTNTNLIARTFGTAGSINYNLAVNPVDGRIAVASTEARNTLRFEPKIRGYMVDTRVTYFNQAGVAAPRILSPHINFDVLPAPPVEPDSALGIPVAVAYPTTGRAYVASLATNKIGVMNPLSSGASGNMVARIPVVEGPTGIVVDQARERLYVVGRFRNQLQTLSLNDFTEIDLRSIGMDPTPDELVHGRRFLYKGRTSGHGDQACATCHIFGDMDNLAWDLGDPFGAYIPGSFPLDGFDPQKGPMTTQTFRGMTNTEPLHWRGDRADFTAFNGAFMSLMGLESPLPDSQMTAFTDFAMKIAYPPNPHQYLDRTIADPAAPVPSAARGQAFFTTQAVDGALTCNNCHTATSFGPGTNRAMIPNEALLESQDLKVPQLRNLYRKTGFADQPGAVNKRGFGFSHDGAIDDIFRFLHLPQFDFGPDTAVGNANRRDLKAFLLAFDTGTAPAVGRQVTFDGTPYPEGESRVDTLRAQADLEHCDLIARGRIDEIPRSWLYLGGDAWQPDLDTAPNVTTTELLATAGPSAELTVLGVPEGSGFRMGIDRDRDGYRNANEVLAGSDPGNPSSTPANVGVEQDRGGVFALRGPRPNPFRERTEIAFTLARESRVNLAVYDVLGRQVRELARDRSFEAGPHAIAWDGRRGDGGQASAGVYFVRIRVQGAQAVRPIVRIR